jgi:hypothetical protein
VALASRIAKVYGELFVNPRSAKDMQRVIAAVQSQSAKRG